MGGDAFSETDHPTGEGRGRRSKAGNKASEVAEKQNHHLNDKEGGGKGRIVAIVAERKWIHSMV